VTGAPTTGSADAGLLTIGDLSRATGVKPTTIRWYEGTVNLLP
jgi:hypothetical protein